MRALPLLSLALAAVAAPVYAQSLSRAVPLDYQRDVTSRNLSGLAARADGRLVAGPFLTELKGPSLGSMAWSLVPFGDGRWLVGTGPTGRLLLITADASKGEYQLSPYVDLPSNHLQALAVTPGGTVLAGGTPRGTLFLIREGKLVAKAALPVEAVHSILVDANDANRALVATGNPARVYAVDLAQFEKVGLPAQGQPAPAWTSQGIKVFAEIKDRHLRRLVQTAQGFFGGSAPKGHLYRFPSEGGSGVIVMENKDSEVTSLLPLPNGDLLAALVVAAPDTENRIAPNTPPPASAAPAPNAPAGAPGAAPAGTPPPNRPAPTPFDRFNGRSLLVRLPAVGSPEILAQKANTAFYDLALTGDLVLVGGGETGDLMGYDLAARLPLTLAGSNSAQLNQIKSWPAAGGHLVLRNNPTGLSLLRDDATRVRTAETKRIDLGSVGTLGAWRPLRIRGVDTEKSTVEVRLSRTADDAEGWSPWQKLSFRDDGWFAPQLVARYVKYRLTLSAGTQPTLDRAEAFLAPENRRPSLAEFRYLPPNFEIRAPGETPPAPPSTVGALLANERNEGKSRNSITNAPVVPSPGTQAVLWNMVDPDGDNLTASLSIKQEGTEAWIPLAVDRRDSFFQFASSTLPEGHYLSRITLSETEPRPAAERLTFTAETDTLTIDRSGPELRRVELSRDGANWVLTVEALDALSPVDRLEAQFNQGLEFSLSQPSDGLRDSRHESFVLTVPQADVRDSSSVEISLFDSLGNATRRRLELR